MKLTKIIRIAIVIFTGLTVASGEEQTASPPKLEIVASKWINLTDAGIGIQGEETVFEGRFVVLGQAVYGHFDIVTYDDSGKAAGLHTSDDRAFVKDHGGNVKSITINLGKMGTCARLEVSFHEMRIEPDVGECLSK